MPCSFPNIYIWDLAAGLAMALRNGAEARYLNGDDFELNQAMLDGHVIDTPVLIGQPATFDAYRRSIRM